MLRRTFSCKTALIRAWWKKTGLRERGRLPTLTYYLRICTLNLSTAFGLKLVKLNRQLPQRLVTAPAIRADKSNSSQLPVFGSSPPYSSLYSIVYSENSCG
jgi:hypothetical protein